MTKRCYMCGRVKPKTEFYKNRAKIGGTSDECRECSNQRSKVYYSLHSDSVKAKSKDYKKRSDVQERKRRWDRKSALKRNYGISAADYETMAASQGYACAICGKKGKRLAVDHCHKYGYIRGLLCLEHNTGLGMFQDSPELLRSGANYLESVDKMAEGIL